MGMMVGKKGVKHDINITPYIDILLVLLIIFMVAAPLKKHDQEIRVPKPAPPNQPKQETKPDLIIVDVESDHTVKLNLQPVEVDKLSDTLFRIFNQRANKNMFIRGDAGLPYGDVFKILDIAKRSGATDIALLDKGEGSSGAGTAKGGP